jgi:hypothetical protein
MLAMRWRTGGDAMRPLFLVCLLSVVLVCVAHAADIPVGNAAHAVCYIFRGSEIITECEVNDWRSTIDVRAALNARDARRLCIGTTEAVGKQTRSLVERKWQLRIFSPFSGDHAIATCPFR